MKAMLVDANKSLVWSEVDEPALGTNQVLIEIHAASLNRADLLQREGKYPSPKGCPPWMGLEVAGVITEVGAEVSRWRAGDRVCALLGGGGYAERVAVDECMVMPIPQGLSMEEAAALPEAFATCYLNLFIEGQYQEGETLFFPAGKSGLASVGIPMARAFGAYTVTSVRHSADVEKVRYLGADAVIDTETETVAQAFDRLAAAGHPVDIAIDCLAGEALAEALPYVNDGCRWVLISTLAGATAHIPLRAILTRAVQLKGSMLRKRPVAEKGVILAALVEKIWPKIERGEIRPCIHCVLPMSEAEEAHDILQRGENIGKVVLKVR